MFYNIMQIFSKLFTFLNPFSVSSHKGVYSVGPNNFAELLKQFDAPKKEKTNEDIIRDYQIKETLAALEVDMLKMDPPNVYKGSQTFYDKEGNKFFDWVPCITRPEVVYCSYGKN